MKIKLIEKVYAADPLEYGDSLPADRLASKFGSPAAIISELLKYVYIAAGLILLLMLISGGIGLMTAAGDQGNTEAAYGRIKNALIGFLIIFASYLIALLVEAILGVKFLDAGTLL